MKNFPYAFSWRARLGSFAFALRGFTAFLKREHNARLHLAAAIVAIAAGIFFKLSPAEWIVIVCCISAVFAAELLNSAMEELCDLVHSEKHPTVKLVKDYSAAAVLILAFAAMICGLVIFIPKIIYVCRSVSFLKS